jgi:serine/threonine protein kinase
VENIMLDARGHVKLIDFGLSQEISQEEEPMSPIGSLIYMAPELLTKSMGGRHTDWYNENEWCWKK